MGYDLKSLENMGAHEGLLAVPSGLKSVVLPSLPLLALGLLESAHQPLHPLMHPQVCPLPSLPAQMCTVFPDMSAGVCMLL